MRDTLTSRRIATTLLAWVVVALSATAAWAQTPTPTAPGTEPPGTEAPAVEPTPEPSPTSTGVGGSVTVPLGPAERPDFTLTPPQRAVIPDTGLFGSQLAFWVAILSAFVAVVLLMAFLIIPALDKPAERVLKRGLRIYSRGASEKESSTGMSASNIGKAAAGLVSAVPKPEGYEEQLQLKLDRAGWPFRASEFIALRVGAGVFGALVGFGLLASVPLGLVLMVAGVIVPGVVLDVAKKRRENQFLAQLPDTLTLLSGALKAGYGLLQAVDTVVQESPEPTKQEFQRVLSEARLGLPLNEALDDMAERVGSEDFRWVVVAINIQAQVGGNLAELLDTIANTLREREMVRRQIAVLSAEGRLSAVILTALPFVIVLYLSVVNPEYIGTLISHWVGRILIGFGLVLMGIGIFWMRKLIQIDV
ncbi:MAG: type II secretion system F family protein [Nitriliruptorales bacterium]|nr:type II secretion system F family protein [Nitriliruptorales bacterium]